MPYCIKCCRTVCAPCVPANDNEPAGRNITVASDEELLRPSQFQRLAVATTDLNLSRREIPNTLADTIFLYDGLIFWPNGNEFQRPDTLIDDAFNDDGSFRWLSAFMAFSETPPKQRPQRRVLDRLRLIDLYFRIAHPDIAQHFGR